MPRFSAQNSIWHGRMSSHQKEKGGDLQNPPSHPATILFQLQIPVLVLILYLLPPRVTSLACSSGSWGVGPTVRAGGSRTGVVLPQIVSVLRFTWLWTADRSTGEPGQPILPSVRPRRPQQWRLSSYLSTGPRFPSPGRIYSGQGLE
jgi:hypothetical protein